MYRKIKVVRSNTGNCSQKKNRKPRQQNMQIHTCKIYVQMESTKKKQYKSCETTEEEYKP